MEKLTADQKKTLSTQIKTIEPKGEIVSLAPGNDFKGGSISYNKESGIIFGEGGFRLTDRRNPAFDDGGPVIGYETYCKIRQYHGERGLSFNQIAAELGIDPETVAKYARVEKFLPPAGVKRASKLDAFKPIITRLLERHPYTSTQILQRLREEGYEGGASILKEYVSVVRPVRHPAFLSLAFAPGEAAQVDWGSAGSIAIGNTRRRLSFFVMVLCQARRSGRRSSRRKTAAKSPKSSMMPRNADSVCGTGMCLSTAPAKRSAKSPSGKVRSPLLPAISRCECGSTPV